MRTTYQASRRKLVLTMDYETPEVVAAPVVNEALRLESTRVTWPYIVPDIEYASTITLNEPVNMGDPKERRGVKLWYV